MIRATLSPPRQAVGFVLLEALITIIILSFGLLGLAGLQAKMQQSEIESYQRSQALLLVQDMTNRLSADRTNAASYVTSAQSPPYLGTGDSEPTSCTGLTGVQDDWCEWSNELKGAGEQNSSGNLGAMVGARGCIDLISSNPAVYRISVAWQGVAIANPPALTCAQNLYGNDSYRRTIDGLVTVANLTAP